MIIYAWNYLYFWSKCIDLWGVMIIYAWSSFYKLQNYHTDVDFINHCSKFGNTYIRHKNVPQ